MIAKVVSGVTINIRSDWYPNYVWDGEKQLPIGWYTEDEYHFGEGLVIHAMTNTQWLDQIQVNAWDAPGISTFEDFPMLRIFADYLATTGRTKILVEDGERRTLYVAAIREGLSAVDCRWSATGN